MTNKLQRIFAACLLSAAVVLSAGCREEDGSGGIFKYNIAVNPGSLDPQTANDPESDMLIASIYRGLLTANPDGSLGACMAEDYVVSEDGLVYTFKIRQDVYWTDSGGFSARLTAHDFVFGFQRLFSPETRAARAAEYFCIKNAEHICNGVIPDLSALGVKAVNDFELEITLGYPNPRFPLLLTQTPAMPCNEEYFRKAQGKYGLAAEATPSNGAFYVRTWDYDPFSKTDNNFIILRRNTRTDETDKVYPSGLNFFIVKDENGRFISDFQKEVTSCIAVTDEQAAAIDGDYTVEDYSNISVGMIFNQDYSPFKNTDFRRALASLVNRKDTAPSLMAYEQSAGVVPAEVTLLDKSYREYAKDVSPIQYSTSKAKFFYKRAEADLDKDLFVGARIILPDDTTADAVAYIMQEWQREFGFYCVVEVLPQEEYTKRLTAGDYEIAVVELYGGYNSPEAYLSSFMRGNTANYSGYHSMDFERTMKQAERATDLIDSADLYVKAEKLLLDEAAFVPLCSKNEYFFIGEDMSDIFYNPFTKTIDFSQAKTE